MKSSSVGFQLLCVSSLKRKLGLAIFHGGMWRARLSDWQEGEAWSSVNVSVALRARVTGYETNTKACLAGSLSEHSLCSPSEGRPYLSLSLSLSQCNNK